MAAREIAQLKLRIKDQERSRVESTNEQVRMLEETVVHLNEELENTIRTAVST